MRELAKRESWKFKMEYDTASLTGAEGSGCQLIDVAVRLISLGSRNTARPFALGGSLEWSTLSPSKYSCCSDSDSCQEKIHNKK